MGADFIFDCVIINGAISNDDAKSSMLKRVNTLKISDLTDNDRDNIRETFLFSNEELSRNTLQALKKRFTEIIKDTFNALMGRACSSLTFKGYRIYLTGGMSWGDDPTDAFGAFVEFNALPACLHAILE